MPCRIQDPLKRWERKQKENKGFFLLAHVTGRAALSEGTTTAGREALGFETAQSKVEVQGEEIPVPILSSPLLVQHKATIKD